VAFFGVAFVRNAAKFYGLLTKYRSMSLRASRTDQWRTYIYMYSLTVRPCDLETRVSGLKTIVYRVIHEDLSLGSETWHRKTIRKIFSKSGHRHKGLDLGITIFCEVLTTPTSQANSRTRWSVPIKF